MSGLSSGGDAGSEIDLVSLVRTLWQQRRVLGAAVVLCATFALVAGHCWPWRWTSSAVLVAPTLSDNPALAQQRASLHALGIDPAVTDEWLFSRFIRTAGARDVQRDFLRSSPVFRHLTAGLSSPERIAAENAMMKGMVVLEPAPQGKTDKPLQPYLTAQLKAKAAPDAQTLLDGWLTYVSGQVSLMAEKTLEEQRRVRLVSARQQLSLTRTREEIDRQVRVTRLEYALSIAKAAGISQPVCKHPVNSY